MRLMNDIAELEEFARVHACAQRIPRARYEAVLGQVSHDGDGPGSWVREWCGAAEAAERGGDLLAASRLYNMARFPYVDGAARQEAWERCVTAFERWRDRDRVDLTPFDVDLDGGRVRCWTTGPRPDGSGPFVLLMGGIVSTKEQWAPVLLRLRRFGVTGVATEMPGVGANTLRYDAGSWRMLSDLLDALAGRVDTARTYAMAMSFSGHLALRCALEDHRIRAVITIGAPINGVFADSVWQRKLPRLTLDTLAHLAGATPADIGGHLSGRELTAHQLAALRIPVAYIASRRDEIIPPEDTLLLKRNVRGLSILENDDVHGSPRHLDETGPWLTRALLRAHGSHAPQRAALSALLPLLRLRHRLAGSR
jgi:esterase FrsA